MDDYSVGYKKPPKQTQFKKGMCPNRNGRGQAKTKTNLDLISAVLDARVSIKENGKMRRLSRLELTIKTLVNGALKGDVGAADWLLKIYDHASKHGDTAPFVVTVINALPDRGPPKTLEDDP